MLDTVEGRLKLTMEPWEEGKRLDMQYNSEGRYGNSCCEHDNVLRGCHLGKRVRVQAGTSTRFSG